MENNRNNVVLTVICACTLLVALVGASFAYFTATSQPTTEQTVTTGKLNISASLSREKTNLIKPTEFSQATAESNNDVAKLTLTVDGTDTTVDGAKYYLSMIGDITNKDGGEISTNKGGEKSEVKWVLINTTGADIATGSVVASGDFSTLSSGLPATTIQTGSGESKTDYLASLTGTTKDTYALLVYIEEKGYAQDNLSEVKITASMTAKAVTPKTDGTYATPSAN